MPLLFAVTLFVSASLLFMVQPMVGKLVLPLLGGSPAVWNACMVFFQALLLLGYLYADRLTRVPDTRKQWVIHIGVMVLPVTAFVLAILLGSRHTPISVAESLAPSEGSSAIISVLLILTVAIGIPFFVVSTSATLLQKWFTYTGHPSARDPYFLYSASNAGSLISLLGYPIFIEPNMTQGDQTWFWAVGFLGLFALITFCGRAAANPLGVPPGMPLVPATPNASALASGKTAGKQGGGRQSGAVQGKQAANVGKQTGPAVDPKVVPVAPPTEAPPSLARMAKWTMLAFVPSSLMLGVTFYMATDIASIPLLWVGPLALYLVTFIIAFGRVPPWFRVLIGNLAPVMILLLVFVLLSGVDPGVGWRLLLHMLTFFAAALMCHYELARDRPSPQYLTTYFLIMSFGGVLGGILNSLLAPIIFAHAYEYRLALNLACLMVPHLNPLTQDDKEAKMSKETALAADAAVNLATNWFAYGFRWLFRFVDRNRRVALVLDIVLPIILGVIVWVLQALPPRYEWYVKFLADTTHLISTNLSSNTVYVVITFAFPVMVCFFFVDRPLRFALAVGAILWPLTINEAGAESLYSERSFFGILKIERSTSRQLLLDRTQFFKITEQSITELRSAKVPEPVLQKLAILIDKDKEWAKHDLQNELAKLLTPEELKQHEDAILKLTFTRSNSGDKPVINAKDEPTVMGRYEYRRLVHGTTLHGTQVSKHERHILDDFQLLTAGNVWDNVAVWGAINNFDMKQEPLTYYHRTGPVGAMFAELQRRGYEKKPVAMVGLGTGSVSCYAQKGQTLTFYEIDPAVIELVADTDKWFTYVMDAGRKEYPKAYKDKPIPKNRGALLDFRIGDARLKLKEEAVKFKENPELKYQLLLVDAFSSDSIPVHLLTVEAVALYMDCITDDGILALHISNKFVKLEPVVEAIAKKHNLVARVWNDDAEKQHGKTASSWVVLARKPEHLGDRLCSPITMLMEEYGAGETLLNVVRDKYPNFKLTADKSIGKQKELILEFLDKKTDDPQALLLAAWIRKYNSEYEPLLRVLQGESGYGFRPLRSMKGGMDPWTDDYADVMRVMMIPQLQSIRRFFGLPALDEE